MSLQKNRPKCSPIHLFVQNQCITLTVERSMYTAQKFGLLFYFTINLPKFTNRKMGENSPNLVTLLSSEECLIFLNLSRGQCYYHFLGDFYVHFRWKKWRFSEKPMLTNVMIHIDLAVWHSGNRVRL
jgi:hypothetical protein